MIGKTFGQYVIKEKIGQGGMGEVYLADDTALQRKVALKFLPAALADSEEFRGRFLVEARAAAALSHPNICVIHEVGEARLGGDEEEGRSLPFIAMEYVEGETLQRKIRDGSLGLDQVGRILGQIVAGLEEAHGKGITHRDIKSSNIMVTPAGRTKIMDFGLAKVKGGPALTKTLTTLGTVAYMSPEQAAGDEVDHRSDLWSTGVVLYEMLTGELPFQGERETAVVHHILHEPPRPIKDLKPPIPAELRRMVERALQKEPKDRYASASKMLEDLRRYEEGVQAEALGVFNLRTLARRLRQPKVAVPTALIVAVLAVSAIWLSNVRAELRWAREEALPEIASLIQANDVWRNLVPPYQLALQAEEILGDDPMLLDLIGQCSREIDIVTEPAGATVYMKEYSEPEADWEFVGVTPLQGVRVPIGIFRWKLEKEGYETVLAAASTWNLGGEEDLIGGQGLFRTLDEVGTLPEGMVRVEATETTLGPFSDFFIGRHEVTNQEYKAFVDAGGYADPSYWEHTFVQDGRELSRDEAMARLVDQTGRPGPATWQGGTYPQGQDDYPVSSVSWYEAAAYAEWAGRSLPTAEHWNVARGGYTPMIQWPQLGGFGVLAPFTNFGGDGPVPVGSLPGYTAYGVFDMPGNVREWCWNDGSAGKVIRGGAWADNTYFFEYDSQAPPMNRSDRNGFRVALYPNRSADPEEAFGFREDMFNDEPPPVPDVSDEVFQVYKENFAYDPMDLNAQVDTSWQSPGGWTHEVVSFDAAYGDERVLAHLFLPESAEPPYQTVVYWPGEASTWMPSSEGLEDYYEFTMFLSYLVRDGRAVLYPVYKGTFERGSPELAALSQPENMPDSRAYAEYLVQAIKDLRRSIDYLEDRPDIDSERLAYYGMSWGGYLGSIIPAVEERFGASVLVAAGVGGLGRPEVNDMVYVTRVRTPTLILNGEYDVFFRKDGSALPMYENLGTPEEDKRIIFYPTDHIPPRNEYVRETLAWLEEYLGPVNR